MTRSFLFVPGNRPERFDKALAAGADAVIIDLEDAVPVTEKALARESLLQWLDASRPVLVRVNGAGTEWFEQDLHACRHPGVAGIVLPKAERAADISRAAEATGVRAILPLVETARGLWFARELAQCPQVSRLVFGSIDYRLDLGIGGDGEELLHARSQLVLASRVAGIEAPIDGVCVELDDPDKLRSDALCARRLGFRGKLCIHPKQVGVVNQAFSPDADEIAWARKIVEAAEAGGGAAVAVDGRMVDRPVILEAQRILRVAALGTG